MATVDRTHRTLSEFFFQSVLPKLLCFYRRLPRFLLQSGHNQGEDENRKRT